jgi:hypothetical protein
LGTAKQLDLQGMWTNGLRTWSRAHNLYQSRTIAQVGFVLIVLPAAWFSLTRLGNLLKASQTSARVASVATACLIAFVLVRGASLHALDPVTGTTVAGMRIGWWVELAALSTIAAAAVVLVLRDRAA